MPLDLTRTVNHYDWCIQRNNQREKWVNAKHIKHFMSSVENISASFAGQLLYYYNTGVGRYLSYGEGTPVFYFFKLVPEERLIRRFDVKPYWLTHNTNYSTIDYLHSVSWSKYTLSTNSYVPETPYVLVVLNEMKTEQYLVAYMNTWAERNKYRVIFKAHPFPTDCSDPFEEWDKIPNKSKYSELCVDANTNTLVDHCSALVSIESGVGFYALLKDKQVSYFRNDIDYSYGLIANLCNSVTDLDSVIFRKLPQQDIYQYLSWFYNTAIIDVATAFDDILYTRFDKYFNRNCTIDEYFTN